MSSSRTPVRLVSIDPGSQFLGVSCFDLLTNRMLCLHGATLDVNRTEQIMYNGHHPKGIVHTKRLVIREFLDGFIRAWKPMYVSIESPYLAHGKSPATFVLSEINLYLIKQKIQEVSPSTIIFTTDPTTPKREVGITKEDYSNKLKVKEKLLQIPDIEYEDDVFNKYFDEHAWDSVLIANLFYRNWKRGCLYEV